MPSVNNSISFGLELECVQTTAEAQNVINEHRWLVRHDGSVRGQQNEELPDSLEIITRPLSVAVHCGQDGSDLSIDADSLRSVAGTVSDLCRCAAVVNKTCGFHIHLGKPGKDDSDWDVKKSDWGPERTRTMLIIGLLMEERLFRACPPSRAQSAYCQPIGTAYTRAELGSYYPMGATLPNNKYDCHKRRCWLNLVETRRKGTDHRLLRGLSHGLGTIEVRLLGNTNNPEYALAWVLLWLKIAAYVAYLPSSLAILRCIATGSIASELNDVITLKNQYDTETVQGLTCAP